MGRERQIGLDAVRGIAILLVLLFHFAQPAEPGMPDILFPVRIAGWTGVELFFVLSGFLVGGIILSESATPAGFDWRRFMVRRAFRLWPIFYLYVAAEALSGVGWSRLWPTLLHLQNYNDHTRDHLWSLAVEEHFYLLAAATLPWLVRNATPRRIFATLVALIVAVNVLRFAAVAGGVSWARVHWETQFRLDALAAGVLLAAVRRYRPEMFAAWQRHRLALVLTALSGFAVVALDIEFLKRWSVDLTLAWLAAVPLVIAASDLDIRGASTRPARVLAGLGLIAYPLYIWHICVANIAATIGGSVGVIDPFVVATLKLSSAIAFAALLHRAVELPFLALRERIGARSSLSISAFAKFKIAARRTVEPPGDVRSDDCPRQERSVA